MTTKPLNLNTPGQTYHDFVVTRATEIPELKCFLRELVHTPTGAEVMHIANEDPENVFCLTLQTLPDTSNGVSHILEHTTLCGSKKYPIKDPFMAMQSRSLNTYMNALTGSDFTAFPAASQIPQDFYNLLSVYLDAIFHPNLNPLDFKQEGHRLEFETPSDPSTPLIYKGVVFNEMKGAMASGPARMNETINAALFPDITYGVNSGGDPKVIPQLTYEELCKFQRYYYHPSHCLFYFYGSFPLEKHLDFIAEHALKGVEKMPPLPPIPLQRRFTEPKRLEASFPFAEDENPKGKTLISFGWLTCNVRDQDELLALCILDIILMETDASPLKMALLKSGYCKQVGAFIDVECNEIPFILNFKGCNPENADLIEALIIQTLKDVIAKGIPLEAVESAIHQLEIYRSEITGDHTPFGLSLFFRSALLKQHGIDPEAGLKIHSPFEELHKKNLAEPHYLTGLIQKHLIDNPHFVRVVMTPDKELAAKELAEEQAALSAIRAQLTEKQEQEIVTQAAKLVDYQKKHEEEDLDILPKVTLKDAPKLARSYVLKEEGGMKVYHHPTFTNGLLYTELTFDLPAIKEEDLSLARLMVALISQVGCGGRTYAENLEFMQAHTGGVAASTALNVQASDSQLFHPTFSLFGKALHRNASTLLTFMKDTMQTVDFTDIPRLKEVISKHYTLLREGLNHSGLRYAINLSASQLGNSSKIANAWGGLAYFHAIQDLARNFDEKAAWLVEKLQKLRDDILCVGVPQLIITCDETLYEELKRHEFYGLHNIKTKPLSPWKNDLTPDSVEPQGRVIASPIAFISKVFRTVHYTHPDAPALSAAASLFGELTLHTRIREQGGAYGSGAAHNSLLGYFYFYTSRDPNISSSLEAFDDAIKEVIEGKFSEADLEKAKLEIIASLDSPVAPGSRGEDAYGWLITGRTQAVRQAYRDRLTSLTKDDVIAAVLQHIVPNVNSGSPVVFAGKELLEKENKALQARGCKPLKIMSI